MPASINPLSNVDAAWLKMEDPTNLMMVTGVLTFARPVDMAYLRALVESRLLQFDRFRQRPAAPQVQLPAPPQERPPPTTPRARGFSRPRPARWCFRATSPRACPTTP